MGKYKQSFLHGTLILVAAGIINRILGFVPRAALPRIIGAEGVGLYQLAYPFLLAILTIITGGIPVAVSKLVAEAESAGNEARVRLVLKVSLLLSASLGIGFMLLCYVAAPWITSRLLTDKRVYSAFLVMIPIILIVALSSVFRGYFQGRQNMIPTAVSQLTETVIRIFAILAFAWLLLPYGLEYAAAGAMLGVLFGEAGSLAVMFGFFWKTKGRYQFYNKSSIGSKAMAIGGVQTLKRILRISVPVTASRLVGSFSYLLESIVLIQSLAIAGIATSLATAQYGALQGMIIPILLLPNALTYSLSVSLVPSLSEAAARGDMSTIHKRLRQSFRLALVAGAPFAVILYVLADPIVYYLYGQTDIGVMLKMMAPIALFIYFQSPLAAALQALDKPGTALVNTLIGAVIKLVLIYMLASRPNLGILGAIMAININTITVTILHWISVSRLLRFSMPASDFLKMGLVMGLTGLVSSMVMNSDWVDAAFLRFVFSLGAGGAVYAACLYLLKMVRPGDLGRYLGFGRGKR